MSEAPEIRLRRLRMRSWRRGMKETDLILGNFADARLGSMALAAIDRFESLLEENDQDIFAWVTGARATPEGHALLIAEIRAFVAEGGSQAT